MNTEKIANIPSAKDSNSLSKLNWSYIDCYEPIEVANKINQSATNGFFQILLDDLSYKLAKELLDKGYTITEVNRGANKMFKISWDEMD